MSEFRHIRKGDHVKINHPVLQTVDEHIVERVTWRTLKIGGRSFCRRSGKMLGTRHSDAFIPYIEID